MIKLYTWTFEEHFIDGLNYFFGFSGVGFPGLAPGRTPDFPGGFPAGFEALDPCFARVEYLSTRSRRFCGRGSLLGWLVGAGTPFSLRDSALICSTRRDALAVSGCGFDLGLAMVTSGQEQGDVYERSCWDRLRRESLGVGGWESGDGWSGGA